MLSFLTSEVSDSYSSDEESASLRCFSFISTSFSSLTFYYNCNNRTYQWELFNSLKIPCDGDSLYEWIRKEVNEVTDIDAYKCDVSSVSPIM